MALAILAVGLTITSVVISGSLQNMRTAKDRVIATNLAREGIEIMRNVRDTNWLKFSNNRRACWNHFPGETLLSDVCDGNTPILPGEYIVYKNNEYRWKLDDSSDESGAMLSRTDINETVDSDLDGQADNDADMYNHILTTDNDALGTAVQTSIFKRVITVEYLENDPDPTSPPSNNTPPEESINTESEWNALGLGATELNRMRVTSTVTWQDGSDAVHMVELKTILTDYLGRTSLGG